MLGAGSAAAVVCPGGGTEAAGGRARAVLRGDLAVLWLSPHPTNPAAVVESRFCQHCQPKGSSIREFACVRCGEGPLLHGGLTTDTGTGAPLRGWLQGNGWQPVPGKGAGWWCPVGHG